MKILKIKLEIFNHKYFSKINTSTTVMLTRRLTKRPSNLLVSGRLVLGCSGPMAKQGVLVAEFELSSSQYCGFLWR